MAEANKIVNLGWTEALSNLRPPTPPPGALSGQDRGDRPHRWQPTVRVGGFGAGNADPWTRHTDEVGAAEDVEPDLLAVLPEGRVQLIELRHRKPGAPPMGGRGGCG